MKLWATLYSVIWIVFLEFLLGLWPNPPAVVPYLHLVLGVGIVLLTYYTYRRLREAPVPGRLKRIARASYALSIFMVFLGVLLWFQVGSTWVFPGIGISIFRLILLLHVANALAIITQCAAVALAYDMWEDREFEKGTLPGEVPAMPRPPPEGTSR